MEANISKNKVDTNTAIACFFEILQCARGIGVERYDIHDALEDVECCEGEGHGPTGRCRERKDHNPYTSILYDDDYEDKDKEPWFGEIYSRLMLFKFKDRFMEKYNDSCLDSQGGNGRDGGDGGNRGNGGGNMRLDEKEHILQ